MTGRLARVWSAVRDALSTRWVRPALLDRRYVSIGSVSPDSIVSSLSLATGGDLRQLADVYDMVATTDAHISGVRMQLVAGITSTHSDVTATDETPEAEAIAEACQRAIERPEANWNFLLEGIVDGWLRGSSLVGVQWNDPGSRRRVWNSFYPVPMQRLKYDRETAELHVVVDPTVPYPGVPVSSFPAGSWVRTQVDTQVPDFALRGKYRTILGDWFARRNVQGWEQQAIERYGMPIPVGVFDTEESREVLKAAFSNFGAAGALIVNRGSEVQWGSAGAASSSGNLVHETFLEKSAARISVAILGAEQSATVQPNQGSKASAQTHENVARATKYMLWDLISQVVRRDLLVPFVRMNFGETAVRMTPRLVPQFDEPKDMLQVAQALDIARGILPIPEGFARELLGIPTMGPNDTALRAAAPAASPFAQPTLPTVASVVAARQRPLPVLVEKAPEGAGAEIADHYRSLVGGVRNTSALPDLARKIGQAKPPAAPRLKDQLATSIFEATLKGIQYAREARKSA